MEMKAVLFELVDKNFFEMILVQERIIDNIYLLGWNTFDCIFYQMSPTDIIERLR
jgi:hypothetical protein